MKYLILLLIAIISGCSNVEVHSDVGNETVVDRIKKERKEKHKYMSSSKSPLPKGETSDFIALNYFPIDTAYSINSFFQLVVNGPIFEMRTNTDRQPAYQKYGMLIFELNNQLDTLWAYKSMEQQGNELFIPFTDLTNGNETYYSGRFIDIEVPEGDSVLLDFNSCYNPYCAYNEKYSCPIPPLENHLNTAILAGEKKYRNDH